jgi:hypothetical protein
VAWIGNGGDRRTELAGGESVEGAEAGREFGVGQAALAIKPAEEIFGGASLFLRVAAQAAGDQVAVGIAPEGHARHNVVEAASQRRKPAQAIKTKSPFSIVNGLAPSLARQEVCFEVVASLIGLAAVTGAENFVRQPHFDHMAGIVALD